MLSVEFQSQDQVEKGQLLVQLDDRQEKVAVDGARLKLKNASRLLKRYEKAVQEGAISQTQLDEAQGDFEEAGVSLKQALLDLADRKILAPFAGVVGIPDVYPGSRVTPSTLITGIDDRKVLHVDFEVPEALAGALSQAGKTRQKIFATTPAFPGESFEGQIASQESRIDPRRRTLKARALIDNSKDQLRPGMSFATRWEVQGDSYPSIAEIALQWGRDGSYCWVVKDSKVQKVPVRVVARKQGRILVRAEINEGDSIVVEGVQRLRPGIEVEVLGEAKL